MAKLLKGNTVCTISKEIVISNSIFSFCTLERGLEKDVETDSNGSDSPEPDEIMTARDSMTTAVLARKQKDVERKKLEKELENVRQSASSLEEVG